MVFATTTTISISIAQLVFKVLHVHYHDLAFVQSPCKVGQYYCSIRQESSAGLDSLLKALGQKLVWLSRLSAISKTALLCVMQKLTVFDI